MENTKSNFLQLKEIKKKIEEEIHMHFFKIINLVYVAMIVFLVFFNPSIKFYEETDFSKFYYLKDGQKVKLCGEINKVERLEKYFLIKLCKEEKCLNGHINYRNEFHNINSLEIEKFICVYGEIKKVYNNLYLNVHEIRQK